MDRLSSTVTVGKAVQLLHPHGLAVPKAGHDSSLFRDEIDSQIDLLTHGSTSIHERCFQGAVATGLEPVKDQCVWISRKPPGSHRNTSVQFHRTSLSLLANATRLKVRTANAPLRCTSRLAAKTTKMLFTIRNIFFSASGLLDNT